MICLAVRHTYRGVTLVVVFTVFSVSSLLATMPIIEASSWLGGECYKTRLTVEDLEPAEKSTSKQLIGFEDALRLAKDAINRSGLANTVVRTHRIVAKPVPGRNEMMFSVDFNAKNGSAVGILQVFVLSNNVVLLPERCSPQ
jgi:hypothetical protein